MENVMKSNKPRYDVVLAQLEYIKDEATKRFNSSGNNKDAESIDKITDDLAKVCMLYHTECPDGYRLEDGMCVPN